MHGSIKSHLETSTSPQQFHEQRPIHLHHDEQGDSYHARKIYDHQLHIDDLHVSSALRSAPSIPRDIRGDPCVAWPVSLNFSFCPQDPDSPSRYPTSRGFVSLLEAVACPTHQLFQMPRDVKLTCIAPSGILDPHCALRW